ncbi:unnamed protein product [Spirodela intermedia]|uniref:DC1 domain-containing protein n=1 Tax=Spirodela intermedia TaxID=51605 RepID=A0A7I8IB30_SPIIN|nr:unnamed protein product [Spirodela intermedia]CAA6654915.1 unnamed protein product [Spirodela intermedia]
MSRATGSVECNTRHFLHKKHPLKFEKRKAPFKCDGCEDLGFDSCYTCVVESCDFHLHTHCFKPDRSLTHRFIEGCSFEWVDSEITRDGKLRKHFCDACGEDAKGRFFYHSKSRCKDLHPSCANLPEFLVYGELQMELKKEIPCKCKRCGLQKREREGTLSWGYVATSNKKTVALHISCMKDQRRKDWWNDYCDACGKLAKGFFYHCYGCGNDLHPTCANLPRFLSYEGLKLELKKKIPFNCCKCGWMNRKSGKGSWCYVSSCKTVAVHISCMKDMLQDNFLENKRMAMPEVVFTEKKGRSEGNLAKIKKAFKIAVPVVLAAVLGDPVTFAVSVIAGLLST